MIEHSVGPGEDRGDEDEDLGLGVRFVDWLSQDLDDLLSLLEISSTEQVDDDSVASEHTLGECLGLLLDVEHNDGRAWHWYCLLIPLNDCAHELVRLLLLADNEMVVTHLLEEAVADETVHTSDESALALTQSLLDRLVDVVLVLIHAGFSSAYWVLLINGQLGWLRSNPVAGWFLHQRHLLLDN